MKKVFTDIVEGNKWSGAESVSGTGSDSINTKHLRYVFPDLLKKLGIKSLLDAPCGDFNWLSQCLPNHIYYTGVDIVDSVVKSNNAKFNKLFYVCDITCDDLPKSDLILCRDCLGHLTNIDIIKTAYNFKKSGSTYLCATHFIGLEGSLNVDIETGQWRPSNLMTEPTNFNNVFGNPIAYTHENSPESSHKYLVTWKIN